MSFPTLESYRVSKALSAKLRLVTLLAVTAVLFVHAYNMTSRFGSGENAAEMSGAPGVVGFIEYLISQALTRWPAAMLFAISGFLFFHNLQPHWETYRRKYAGRLRTVVVPFLLWSALGLALYLFLQALPQSSAYFSRDFLGELSVGHIADKLLFHPVAYPLWFLQTLIVCFVLAPLLYWPARVLRWLAPLPFAVLWILGTSATNWNDWKGLTFFTLGAVIALERRRGVTLTPAPWVGRLLFPLWLLTCVLFTAFLRGEATFWAHSLHKALMCMAMAAIWLGYETYLQAARGQAAGDAAPALQLLHLRRPGAAAHDDQARRPARAGLQRRRDAVRLLLRAAADAGDRGRRGGGRAALPADARTRGSRADAAAAPGAAPR